MRRSSAAVLVVLVAMSAAGAACSSGSNATLNAGDTLHMDVEASTLPPENASDANTDPDGVFARVDGSGIFGSYSGDAYAVRSICSPPDAAAGSMSGKDGGKTNAEPEGGVQVDADGGGDGGKGDAAAYPTNQGDAAYPPGRDAGCEPFPAVCATQPNCECLLGMLASEIPCTYPSCAPNMKTGVFNVYCPP